MLAFLDVWICFGLSGCAGPTDRASDFGFSIPGCSARFADVRGTLRIIVALSAALSAGGCFHSDAHRSGYTEDGKFWCERVADTVDGKYIDELRGEILALGEEGEVDPHEAAVLADTSVRHAAALARSYRMVRPIEIHNTLVNLGLRRRGLCYQTAEDMYVRLRELDLETLQLHWGVAHKGDLWLEHSGVIVTARGRPFSEGLVIDAWRHSGRLRWARVGQDRYPWVRMFKGKFPELREEAVREAQLAAERQKAQPHDEEAGQRVDSRAGAVRTEGDGAAAGAAAEVRAPAGTASSAAGTAAGRGRLSAIVTRRPKPE